MQTQDPHGPNAHARRPIVVVVTTLGRTAALGALLESLSTQLTPRDRISVVAQGNGDAVAALCRERRERVSAPIIVGMGGRGASAGRNAAVAQVKDVDDEAILVFPNDTSRFPPGSIEAIRALPTRSGAMEVRTTAGPRFRLPNRQLGLTPVDVWAVIEPGLVMSLTLFRQLNGFDENIGTGAPSPWQAGEAADLLLRLIKQDPDAALAFYWIPPDTTTLIGIDETHGLNVAERRRKLRSYGRGISYVYRKHRRVWPRGIRFALAGLVIGFRRRNEYAPLDGLWAVLGRLEGLFGWTIGGRLSAVER